MKSPIPCLKDKQINRLFSRLIILNKQLEFKNNKVKKVRRRARSEMMRVMQLHPRSMMDDNCKSKTF